MSASVGHCSASMVKLASRGICNLDHSLGSDHAGPEALRLLSSSDMAAMLHD